MNKNLLVKTICETIELDLQVIKDAALAAHKAATDPENKAENAYDTRGLEASYLAGAQAKRAAELEEVLYHCRNTVPQDFGATDAIAPTALVEIDMGLKTSWVFILVKGAGMNVPFDGKNIQTITPTSPLGEGLLGLKKGDTAEVEQGGRVREFKIVSVI